jgi:FO synthase
MLETGGMIIKEAMSPGLISASRSPRVIAIVPVKRLTAAKQRLASFLGDRRAQFAFLMAVRVLRALSKTRLLAATVVVTSDSTIDSEARLLGATVVQDHDAELNAAIQLGVEAAVQQGAEICLVLPADLACISTESIDELVKEFLRERTVRGDRTVALVRCKDGSGTNFLAFDCRHPPQLAFGLDSFEAHWQSADGHAVELRSAEIAFDIDSADDVRRFVAQCRAAPLESTESTDPLAQLAGEVVAPERRSTAYTAPSLHSLMGESPSSLLSRARALRDQVRPSLVTYSRKVFLPLTHLCRDSCHYCTFARAPRGVRAPYLTVDEVLSVAKQGARVGCKEALFTLGDRPEARYKVALEWLHAAGFDSTLEYVRHVAAAVLERTGLLPHINAGCMSAAEMAMLRPVAASMGLMLESTAARLCERGGPHYGSPDKVPAVRLAMLEEAGRQKIPFTTGILIGIGETREERIDALLCIADLQARFGHIQEVIIQNFVPKQGTKMAASAAPGLEELLWTIAVARSVLGPQMSIQAPPNLAPGTLSSLIHAGINDWGGVSPVTPDFVNPESPWPEIESLRGHTAIAGKVLAERLTIYPQYIADADKWLDKALHKSVFKLSDSSGLGREDQWETGRSTELPAQFPRSVTARDGTRLVSLVDQIVARGVDGIELADLAQLFEARDSDFDYVCNAADVIREEVNGGVLTYVINRNINYTNICGYHCSFCAFSKGTRKHAGAERGYLLDFNEIVARSMEARDRGATEVCLQGGIHPSFTGETYLQILQSIKQADPRMHVHAFSPLEVWHGATTLGMRLHDYLALLKSEGLGSLPGTAAEILVDSVRRVICPDKLNTNQWLEVIETAHEVGLRTTATIMFGHVDKYADWAEHLLKLRELQRRTHGFTEFVPLPFVPHEAPIYKRGLARPGPTLRESVLMHAVARLVLHPYFTNVQTSWVKMGYAGMKVALRAGANDLGGTLMNESITRAAGATHGQQMALSDVQDMAATLGRNYLQRTTLYGRPSLPQTAPALLN